MVSHAPARPVKAQRNLGWLPLALITLLTLAALVTTFFLRHYANDRQRILQGLEQLETLALNQSNLMWQALGEPDRLRQTRLRGQEQMGRQAIYAHLSFLADLETRLKRGDALLGLNGEENVVETLELYTGDFLANVQGVFGQLSISPAERLRQRFTFGDPRFESLQGVISEISEDAAGRAARANRVASASTVLAVALTLGAAFVISLRLGRLRARSALELLEARTETLTASEARFRALVQNSSDLIVVLEPDGSVRYASPASEAIVGLNPERIVGQPFWQHFGLGVAPESGELSYEHAGERRTLELHVADLSDHPDVAGVVVNARDISERKALEARLRYQALHDPLTGLANRRKLDAQLAERLAQNEALAVLFIDLDGFKLVNDSYGHRAGDHLLTQAANRIESCLAEGDLLARQGGDEFIVVCHQAEAEVLAERMLEQVALPFSLDERDIFVSASLGIAFADEASEADTLIQQADIAMYHAKRAGKGRASVYREDMATVAPERLHLQSDFKRALERNEFSVYYQPKVNLANGEIESLEALVRWEHPDKGLISPGLFIPFAEETGLIEPLGKFILDTACQDAADWQDVVIAVNLSPLQFRNPHLVEEVSEALKASGLEPGRLELEITESAVLGDTETTVEILKQLKALGVRLAIDDFGTGYSNLSHLKTYDVDVLKIDQSFIRGGLPASQTLSDQAIVEAVIAMAKAFNLHVVAEGVETPTHAEQLRELGCDLGQGYYFSKPVTKADIDTLLAAS